MWLPSPSASVDFGEKAVSGRELLNRHSGSLHSVKLSDFRKEPSP